MQTNATLINDAWCDLFVEYDFQVGVSLDGSPTHNAARLDWAGRSSWERVMRGVERLRTAGIDFSVICVVTSETIGHANQLVEFFTNLGCASVGFNLEEQEGGSAKRRPITVEQAEAFWLRLWELRDAGAALPIRELDRLCRWIERARSDEIAWKPFDPIPTVSYDGDVVRGCPESRGTSVAARV